MKTTLSTMMALLGSLVVSSMAFAAPIPGTSSSAVVAPKLGLYRSPNGFQMQAGLSNWQQIPAPTDNKYIETVYTTPKNGIMERTASLTVRVDKMDKTVALPAYVARWQKEYPKYGFDVLGAKPFKQNKSTGYVMDLINRQTHKQMRQVIFMNEPKRQAVILTCRDNISAFAKTLKSCNEITRTFAWTTK